MDILNEFDIIDSIDEVSYLSPKNLKTVANWQKNSDRLIPETFKSSTVTDEDYEKLKGILDICTTTDDYKKYKPAFDELCKYCHTTPGGTVIYKHILSKGKIRDRNTLLIKYSYNTRPISLPEGSVLYHQSTVGGIDALKPFFRLRGKGHGYLCDTPRVYLTLSKALPRFSSDNEGKSKLHSYELITLPSQVFVDPLAPDILQRAVYVETDKPLPVKEIKPPASSKILSKLG